MATDKPRFTISVSDQMLQDIESHQKDKNFSTRSSAVQDLIMIGIANIDADSKTKKASSDGLSEEASKVGKDYAKLDPAGKSLVRVVIAEEEKRVKADKAAQRKRSKITMSDGDVAEPRTIPHYYTPAAAGYAEPIFEDDFEYIEVGGDVPVYADFAVDIDGDSMEPYIMDGSTVYVNKDPLEDGDIGIFSVDGDMVCKQYQRSADGTVHLLSLNRAREDADRHISADSGSSVHCFGRVILPSRPNKVRL